MSRYFRLVKKSKRSSARRGILYLKHGVVKTPLFMPIATLGVVKTLSFDDLKQLDAQMILANTYHLMTRPGINLIEKAGEEDPMLSIHMNMWLYLSFLHYST